MPTGFETKKVIVSAGDAAKRPQATINIVDWGGSAVIVGRAEAGVDDTVADAAGPARSRPEGRRRTDRCRGYRRLSKHHRGPPNRAVVSDMKRAMARLASSTTLNFASLGSLAQSRPTIDPSIIADDDMAWLLVDAVKSCLTGDERTIVFVELGCGESYLVIKRLLTALLSTRMALPVAILSKLTGWLNGYTGSPEEPQLRMMLAVIRLQQSEAV